MRNAAASLVILAFANVGSNLVATSPALGKTLNVGPPATAADVRIVERAGKILKSPKSWNRNDTRICPTNAKTYSLYCALEKATIEIDGYFANDGAAMLQSRLVIDDLTNRKYSARLMDYNNAPSTSFADVHRVLKLTRQRMERAIDSRTTPLFRKA